MEITYHKPRDTIIRQRRNFPILISKYKYKDYEQLVETTYAQLLSAKMELAVGFLRDTAVIITIEKHIEVAPKLNWKARVQYRAKQRHSVRYFSTVLDSKTIVASKLFQKTQQFF